MNTISCVSQPHSLRLKTALGQQAPGSQGVAIAENLRLMAFTGVQHARTVAGKSTHD
jgi:hypothetical protein